MAAIILRTKMIKMYKIMITSFSNNDNKGIWKSIWGKLLNTAKCTKSQLKQNRKMSLLSR